jgi:hypothetical protein
MRPMPISIVGDSAYKKIIDIVWFILIIGFYLILFLRQKKIRVEKSSYFFLILFFFSVLSLASSLTLLDRNIILIDLLSLFLFPLYFLTFNAAYQLNWDDESFKKYFFRPFILAFICSACVTLSSAVFPTIGSFFSKIYYFKSSYSLNGIYLSESFRIRISGTFGNPNFYGVVLNFIFPFLFAKLKSTNYSLQYVLLVVVNILLIIFTGSRTAVAGLLIQFFIFTILTVKGHKLKMSIPWIFGAGIFLFLFGVYIAIKFSRIADTINTVTSTGILSVESLGTKYNLSSMYLSEVISKSPLIGMGPSEAYSKYFGDNQYSLLIYKYGIIGLSLYLSFWISCCYKIFKRRRKKMYLYTYVTISVLVYLLFGFTGAFFDATQISTFILLSLGTLLSYSENRTYA